MMPFAFVNQQNNSNQQYIYMNLAVVSATELTNDLKHKTEWLSSLTIKIFYIAHLFISYQLKPFI